MTRLLTLLLAVALWAVGSGAAETRAIGLREAIRLAIAQKPRGANGAPRNREVS